MNWPSNHPPELAAAPDGTEGHDHLTTVDDKLSQSERLAAAALALAIGAGLGVGLGSILAVLLAHHSKWMGVAPLLLGAIGAILAFFYGRNTHRNT
jgi:hypothetical protein